MILFFGTRPGKKESQKLKNVTCAHCGQRDTLSVVSQPNYAHVFWIPIVTLKTARFAECSHCKRGFHEEEFTHEMKQALD